MKKFNWISATALLFVTACQTNASASFTWTENGAVSGVGGKKLQLDIQGVYDGMSYEGLHYLAGFKIDEEGNNYPNIVQLRDDLSSVKYWQFNYLPNDIFVYQKNIHSVNTDGEVYKLERDEWKLISLRFPPDSQVVYSDNNLHVIVCYPASLAKTESRNSGCKSLNNQWQRDFVWYTKAPKMCDGKLYAVAQKADSNTLKKVDIISGKEIFSSKIEQIPEDICSL